MKEKIKKETPITRSLAEGVEPVPAVVKQPRNPKPSVDATQTVFRSLEVAKEPFDRMNYVAVLQSVHDGNYTQARDILDTLSKEEQASIKIHIALQTQVML